MVRSSKRWRRRGRLGPATAAAIVGLLVVVAAPDAAPAQTAPQSPREELLDRFAPVMAVRRQKTECGSGERYRPMTVDAVLGRDDVVLRDADDDIVVRAPTAKDLAGLGPDHWLDFPGDALKPGCDYEKWFRSFDTTPSIYGRVTTDQGTVVVQYWFYWVFNQWNDVHESDWEMIQLHFDTDRVREALRSKPSLYSYAQHEGAEVAEAGDDKVQIVDGTHPVVYSSGGSHASYYSSTRWFGKAGATGFGCDDTTGPIDRIEPEVVALPSEAPRSGEFAWLSYEGHWGQRELLFNNGPTGPASKEKWAEPVDWVEENGRDESVALPFALTSATQTFCGLSAAGSSLLNELLAEPIQVVVLAIVVLVSLAMIVRLASRGLLTRAGRTWWRHRRTLLEIGVVVLVGGVLAWALQFAVLSFTKLGALVDVVGSSSPWVLPIVALTSAVVLLPVTAWVVSATMAVEAGDDDPVRALSATGGTGAPVLCTAMTVVALLGLSLFVLPFFVIPASYWIVAPAASSREHLRVRASLKRSSRLLVGYRWRSLALVVTLCLILAVSGVVGALVLLITSIGFTGAAITVAIVNAFLVPYAALVAVHFYEEVASGAPRGRRAQRWGRVQA